MKVKRYLRAVIRGRLLLLRQLRNIGRGRLLVLVGLLIAQALLPAATAIVTAAVVSNIETGSGVADALEQAALPLVMFGLVLFAGQAVTAALVPLSYLCQGLIDGAHRARLATLAAATPTIDLLDRPEAQDLIRRARADPMSWSEKTPADGALAQLRLLTRYLGVASSAAIVATYSIWLVPVLVIPALLVRAQSRRQSLAHHRALAAGVIDGRQAEYWHGVAMRPAEAKELRIFGFGEWIINRRQWHTRNQMEPVWERIRRALRAQWSHFLLMATSLAVVFLVVGYGTAAGGGTIATLTAVTIAGWGVFTAIASVSDAHAIEGAIPVINARLELERLFGVPAKWSESEVLRGFDGQASRWTHGRQARVLPERPPVVRFHDVHFSYPGSVKPVLAGLDLEIKPGELLAIVGFNGAGKSTLIQLLAGLYRPTTGRITADGVCIDDHAFGGIAAWRRQLAFVFQDFVKYQLSAEDNIAFGKAAPDDRPAQPEVLHAAAVDAGLTEVLSRLPAGTATPLARTRTNGVDLSGGQWQKVALARALYAVRTGARVLVLDEPTAHLDVRTEREVFRRLPAVTRDVSVVLISHRLATVRHADRIVLLQDGRITESGSHEQLMEEGGRYAEMFTLQAERFVHTGDSGAGASGGDQ